MGKRINREDLWKCPECEKKSEKEYLIKQGFIYEIKAGTVTSCPKCGHNEIN